MVFRYPPTEGPLPTPVTGTWRDRVAAASPIQFASELEQVSPKAGEPDGPTTEDPEVKRVTNNFNFTINGDGNNFAAGADIRQKTVVRKGDIDSPIKAALSASLDARRRVLQN
jgi:hypothetical protein